MAAVVVVLRKEEPECVGVWWYFFSFSSRYRGIDSGLGGPLKICRMPEQKVLLSAFGFWYLPSFEKIGRPFMIG